MAAVKAPKPIIRLIHLVGSRDLAHMDLILFNQMSDAGHSVKIMRPPFPRAVPEWPRQWEQLAKEHRRRKPVQYVILPESEGAMGLLRAAGLIGDAESEGMAPMTAEVAQAGWERMAPYHTVDSATYLLDWDAVPACLAHIPNVIPARAWSEGCDGFYDEAFANHVAAHAPGFLEAAHTHAALNTAVPARRPSRASTPRRARL